MLGAQIMLGLGHIGHLWLGYVERHGVYHIIDMSPNSNTMAAACLFYWLVATTAVRVRLVLGLFYSSSCTANFKKKCLPKLRPAIV
ncbi:hypothetical protein DSUL_90038 [Desulfovibrionales bacterium]